MLDWKSISQTNNTPPEMSLISVRLNRLEAREEREWFTQNVSVLFDSVLGYYGLENSERKRFIRDQTIPNCRLGRLRISRVQLRPNARHQLALMYNVGYYPIPSAIESVSMRKEDLSETRIKQILDGGEKVKTDFLIGKLYEKLIFDNKEVYDFMHAVPIIVPYLRNKYNENFESAEIFDVVKSLCYFLTRRQKEEVLIHMDKIFEDEN